MKLVDNNKDKRIAFFSFADIDNFGDILFSHIFKMEVEKRIKNVVIDFYSPSDFSVEGINYNAYSRKEVESKNYDALIVFGGEVIHLFDERTWKPIYAKNNKIIKSNLPSDTIFDWVEIKNTFKAWISVGVRPIENDLDSKKIIETVEKLDFVSTRGILSKKILENLELQNNNTQIEITPDMGWLFYKLLDYKNINGKFYKALTNSSEYLVFQINNINQNEAKQIGNYLLNFQIENNCKVILLPVIRPWEDFKYLELINQATENKLTLLPNNLSILEIADILIHAKYILSSSLHASITGLSAGVPSAIINKWQGSKLQDIFGHQFRLHMLRHKLSDIPYLLDQLKMEHLYSKNMLESYSKFMNIRLEKTFDLIIEKIVNYK